MKPRLANPALADRGARLAGVGFTDRLVPRRVGALPTAQPTSRACAEPAAPSDSSPDGAVFCHFTESLSVGAEPSVGRTIVLDDHSMILLRAVADYEQCSNEHAAALALAVYAACPRRPRRAGADRRRRRRDSAPLCPAGHLPHKGGDRQSPRTGYPRPARFRAASPVQPGAGSAAGQSSGDAAMSFFHWPCGPP
ncbi:MAG: hypothetical protein EOS55_14065 [Mesorhizobium sp.]|nr:MAG: hypothetical protein EOS55_14065 [Mesorhizobium sp.]